MIEKKENTTIRQLVLKHIEENVIIAADLNKHLGNIVPNNHDKVTFGGSLVRNFLASGKYVLLNNLLFIQIQPCFKSTLKKKSLLYNTTNVAFTQRYTLQSITLVLKVKKGI